MLNTEQAPQQVRPNRFPECLGCVSASEQAAAVIADPDYAGFELIAVHVGCSPLPPAEEVIMTVRPQISGGEGGLHSVGNHVVRMPCPGFQALNAQRPAIPADDRLRP